MLIAIWNIWIELAVWLLLGALAAGLLHVLVPAGWMKKHLSGRMGVLKAVAIGVPLPLCSCGVIPVGLGLRKSGASNGAAVGFLISTPQTGVDSVLVSASMLGWPFAILKVVVALVTGMIGGVLANMVPGTTDSLDTADDFVSENKKGFWKPLIRHSLEIIESIWGWLLIGVLVSAAISWMFPEDSLSRIPMLTGVSALLLTLLLSLPLYVCATASVPIAAALVSSGLPAGAALVFLMAGPATNIATLGAVYRALGFRVLAIYLGTIVGGSLIAGIAFNSLITGNIAMLHNHNHSSNWWRIACGVVLAGMIAWFAVSDVRTFFRRRNRVADSGQSASFRIQGMTCNGCAARLENALIARPEITQASVSFDNRQAIVTGNVTQQQVQDTVAAAGFLVVESVTAN